MFRDHDGFEKILDFSKSNIIGDIFQIRSHMSTKIPVKIVEYTIDGERRKNVMIDMLDTYDIEGDPEEKIKNFKEK